MVLRHLITILFVLLVGNAWAQSAVTMKFQPGKLMNWYYLIVPEQGHYFFEIYSDFMTHYYMDSRDTINVPVDEFIANDARWTSLSITAHDFDTCNSLVNDIRQHALRNRTLNFLEAVARNNIGGDNIEFRKGLFKTAPLVKSDKMCFHEFSTLNRIWFSNELDRLDSILNAKEQRLETMQLKSEYTLLETRHFLEDYSRCIPDYKLMILHMVKSPNEFIEAVDGISDSDFIHLSYSLKWLSKELNADEAKLRLKYAAKSSPRKGQLMRSLKKWKGN